MSTVPEVSKFERARAAFDTIAEAMYYGMAFREILTKDVKALEAAEFLAEAVKKVGKAKI